MNQFLSITVLALLAIAASPSLAMRRVLGEVPVGGRIIGGHLAKPGQFPFITATYIDKTDGYRYFCGGTILNSEWILTAGHCVYGGVRITLHFGITDLTASDPNRVTTTSTKYFIHPQYDPTTLANDVALIQLKSKLTFNEFIKPIQYMPISNVPNSAPVVALGWGLTSDSAPTISNELYYVYLTTIPNADCISTYGSAFVRDSVVCVVGRTNEGACTADSGGPLVQIVNNGYIVHAGVTSFVSGLGCERYDPSGYSRTFEFLDYIKNVTGI